MQVEPPISREKQPHRIAVFLKTNNPDTLNMKEFSRKFEFDELNAWIHCRVGPYKQMFIVSEKGNIEVEPTGSTIVDYLQWKSEARSLDLLVVRRTFTFNYCDNRVTDPLNGGDNGRPDLVTNPQQPERVLFFGRVPVPENHVASEVAHTNPFSWKI